MNARKHAIILACLAGIALVSAAAGGALGYRLGRQEMRHRADPEVWHERATRRFAEMVRPTPAQEPRLTAHLDVALTELRQIRQDAIARSVATIERLVAAVEAELTPEQKAAFAPLKPRREDLDLDVLQLERGERKSP
jgi:hypothetical protein